MPKVAHAAKLAYLRRLCLASDSMHVETARLIETLATEPRYALSAATLKPKPRRRPKP
jgi:hypothetical protein